MNNKLKTKTILILIIVINILLAGLYALAFEGVQAKKDRVLTLSLELEEYLSKEGAVNILKGVVKDTKDSRKKLESYFVSRDDLPEFAKKIESIGEASGVSLEIKRFTRQGNTFSFDVSSEGSFRNTLHLIVLIESMPFKVEIKKAYINTTKSTGDRDTYTGVWIGNFGIELVGFVDN